MTTYNTVVDYWGLPVGLGVNGSTGFYGFCLCAEGPNAYTYTSGTGYASEHTKDVRSHARGSAQTVSGTWQLTTSVSNLGTSSLVVPSTGYLRTANVQKSSDIGTMSGWVYLTAYPSVTRPFFGKSDTSSLLFGNRSNDIHMLIDTSGHLGVYHEFNGITYIDYTSTATIPLSTWTFVTWTWERDKSYISIGGTVENTGLSVSPIVDGQVFWYTGFYATSEINTAGLHVDDFEHYEMYNSTYASNFTPPATELETYYTTNVANIERADYVYSPFRADSSHTEVASDIISIVEDAPFDANLIGDSGNSYLVQWIRKSAGMQKVLGIQIEGGTDGRILNDSESSGGSPRPSSGFLYPRGY